MEECEVHSRAYATWHTSSPDGLLSMYGGSAARGHAPSRSGSLEDSPNDRASRARFPHRRIAESLSTQPLLPTRSPKSLECLTPLQEFRGPCSGRGLLNLRELDRRGPGSSRRDPRPVGRLPSYAVGGPNSYAPTARSTPFVRPVGRIAPKLDDTLVVAHAPKVCVDLPDRKRRLDRAHRDRKEDDAESPRCPQGVEEFESSACQAGQWANEPSEKLSHGVPLPNRSSP
jgi:hypothetical protein